MSKGVRIAVTAITTAVLAVLLLAGGAGASWYYFVYTGHAQTTAVQESNLPTDVQKEFSVFWQAWDIAQKEYYARPVDPQKLVYGAAQGMIAALGDGYSVFVDPTQNQDFKEHLGAGFEGIGAWMELRDNHLTVVSPIPGSPAEKAGLRAGDIIVKVDGKDITTLSLPESVDLVRGAKDTAVKLTIVRAGQDQPIELDITRAEIKTQVVSSRMLDNNLAYIRVISFGETLNTEFDQALRDALDQKAKGVIVDLRGNGGGYVDQARQMLGRFLPDGVAFYEEIGQGGQQNAIDVVTGDVKAYDIPLVVLVDGGSASASEIVAGALQDRGRAKLVGEKTFGKGSVQAVHDLSDGSSVRITFAHWLTPNKRQIQGQGLTPDYAVTLTEEQYNAGQDPQLDAAQKVLLGQPVAAEPEPGVSSHVSVAG
jgi:carboxyl-terminal processing protease